MILTSVKEFIDYIPNCVICKKPLQILVGGLLNCLEDKKEYHITMKLKDQLLINKYEHQIRNRIIIVMELKSLHIDINTNKIVEGGHFINNLYGSEVEFKKQCATCKFIILGTSVNDKIKKTTILSPISIRHESVSFTAKNNIQLSITNNYFFRHGDNYCADNISIIYYNNKYFQSFTVDFRKINSTKKIINRIKTILTFQ